ncbi:MAG: hypothetical protein HYY85_06885 [Deltaproteobacteria bacterium]|nr:hypothetical protein [Deltaproteobacteria bacterium]
MRGQICWARFTMGSEQVEEKGNRRAARLLHRFLAEDRPASVVIRVEGPSPFQLGLERDEAGEYSVEAVTEEVPAWE